MFLDLFGLSHDVTGAVLAALCTAAFVAGFVDSVVGGGGLIQVPALFALMPGAAPAVLLGTNKIAGVLGTSAAALQFALRTRIAWNAALPAAGAALFGAFVGAWTATRASPAILRSAIPVVLAVVAAYTWSRKDFGSINAPIHSVNRERVVGAGMGGAIGFYDGLFGPGTGSFLIFAFVRYFGFDFVSASAAAKIVNVACNASALMWFWIAGTMDMPLGLAMALFNVVGSLVGSRLALRRGIQFVRGLFLVVVTALLCKTAVDAFLR